MQHVNSKAMRMTRVIAIGCVTAAAFMGARPFTRMFAELSGFKIASYSISAGASTTGVATVTSIPKSPIPVVSFTSSNAAVAKVPTSMIVSADGTATIPVSGVAAGCAQVTAAYGGRTRMSDIVVQPPVATTSFSVKVPNQLLLYPGYADGSITRTLNLQTTDTRTGPTTLELAEFSLSSSNTAVVTVPAKVRQISSSTAFRMTTTGEGCATITVRAGTQSVSKVVLVRYIGG